MKKETIDQICQDLYTGVNYPGRWHGYDNWGAAADFHEHGKPIWELIQKLFLSQGVKPLNIVETGRCTGQSTNLFSAIAQYTGGYLKSFDIANWNYEHIVSINNKYGTSPAHYQYIVNSSLNAANYLKEDEKIDILFLDSLHTYELVKNETLLFEKYLSPTSLVLFHDTVWCFDSVMGWALEYMKNKNIFMAKCKDTHTKQCNNCDFFNDLNRHPHGRPIMLENGRPQFQSIEEVKDSPYFNTLNYNDIKWCAESFENLLNTNESVFTNIEACCGVGILVLKR